MFSDVMLNIDYGNQVVVPQGAVLDSGERQTVFVALPDGYFEPREIKTGAKVDEKVIVLSGLTPGETIVSSGNFLIDSESRLSSAMSGMKHLAANREGQFCGFCTARSIRTPRSSRKSTAGAERFAVPAVRSVRRTRKRSRCG